jgi:hypothetical protein
LLFKALLFFARKEIGMNCANHPETPVAAYCQFCGKPLCDQCIHKVNNIVSCEPCLAARVHAAAGPYGPNINYGQSPEYIGAGYAPPSGIRPQPVGTGTWVILAFISWIPGVGAMYNGQFAKAFAHVIIFALLVDLHHYNGAFGLLVAAWVFYQVFDAYHTAIARRDGLPLPNPLGLNNIGQWFGARTQWPHAGANSWNTNSGNANPANANSASPNPPAAPSPGVAEPAQAAPFASSYSAPPAPPVPPSQYNAHDFWHSRDGRGIPTGAVVLIVIGVAFLLGNLGILGAYWIDRGWPILLIALGVWLMIRRSQTPPTGGVR